MSENPYISLDLIDADTKVGIEDLSPAISRVFKPQFNGPGSWSFTLPIDSDAARVIRRRKHELIFFRNGRAIWSGAITGINHRARDEKTDVTATGFLEEADRRYVRKSEEAALTFPSPGTVGGTIARTLIETMNAQTDTDAVVRPTRIVPGTVSDTQVRIRSYKQGDNYGAKLRELREIENGHDIVIDPLTLEMSTKAPDDYADRVGVQFGYGVDPNNLDDVVESGDGLSIANRINVVAANGIVYAADDADAIVTSGVMLEDWLSLSDLNDPSLVGAYANGELVYRRYGNTTYTLTPASFGDLPRPYDDFEWGDKGYLSVDLGAFQLEKQGVRLFSATLTYTDQGDEVISDLVVINP